MHFPNLYIKVIEYDCDKLGNWYLLAVNYVNFMGGSLSGYIVLQKTAGLINLELITIVQVIKNIAFHQKYEFTHH